MPRLQEKIQEQVRKILRDNKIQRPPVPVEQIAENYGIEIRYEPAEEELSGALIRKGRNKVVIGVNSFHHPNRQRFTIAHEIAHFLLHEGIKVHVDQDFRVNLRDEQSSKAVSWEEIEANGFAAELLMPTAFITRDTQRFQTFDEQTKQRLANRYRVSKHAMGLRLANLGLDSPV
jgi:Zn-dependent peptidase ImmA (M78 family)